MKRRLADRLAALEAAYRLDVPSDEEYEAALERMRCRFTVLRARRRRANFEVLQLMGRAPAGASPPTGELTAAEKERVRNHCWEFPVISLKSPAEAAAFLGPDSASQVTRDLETLNRWGKAHERGRGEVMGWAEWLERNRPCEIALDEYERTRNPRPLLDLALAEVRAQQESAAAGWTTTRAPAHDSH